MTVEYTSGITFILRFVRVAELGGPTGGISSEFRLLHQTLSVHANRVSPANVVNMNAPRVPEVLLPLIFI
jgi:hypothetical protein